MIFLKLHKIKFILLLILTSAILVTSNTSFASGEQCNKIESLSGESGSASEHSPLFGTHPELSPDLSAAYRWTQQQVGHTTMDKNWESRNIKKLKYKGVKIPFAQLADGGEKAAGLLAACPYDGTISPLIANPFTKTLQCHGCGSHVGLGHSHKSDKAHNDHYILQAPQKVSGGHIYALPMATLSDKMKEIYYENDGKPLWVCSNSGCGHTVNFGSQTSCTACSTARDKDSEFDNPFEKLQDKPYDAINFTDYNILEMTPEMLTALADGEPNGSFNFHTAARNRHKAISKPASSNAANTSSSSSSSSSSNSSSPHVSMPSVLSTPVARINDAITNINNNQGVILKRLIGAATITAVVGAAMFGHYQFSTRAKPIEGEITQVETIALDNKGSTVYIAEVEFKADGETSIHQFNIQAQQTDQLSVGMNVDIKATTDGNYELIISK